MINILKACWKGSYGRGAGTSLSECGDGYEKNGALCYPTCATGYYGVGPVCWEKCQDEFDDHGVTCFRNANIYGKGCCCTAFDVGCCYKCLPGYTDDGCTCRRDVKLYFKKSYARTAGVPLSCKKSEEQSGALCYQKCATDYYGVGPVCWFTCTGTFSHDCGIFCSKNYNDCVDTSLIVAAIPVASLVLLVPENKCDGT